MKVQVLIYKLFFYAESKHFFKKPLQLDDRCRWGKFVEFNCLNKFSFRSRSFFFNFLVSPNLERRDVASSRECFCTATFKVIQKKGTRRKKKEWERERELNFSSRGWDKYLPSILSQTWGEHKRNESMFIRRGA